MEQSFVTQKNLPYVPSSKWFSPDNGWNNTTAASAASRNLHLFIKHTSAGFSINENADPMSRRHGSHLQPPGERTGTLHMHTCEGDDDMPAHAKSTWLVIVSAYLSLMVTEYGYSRGVYTRIPQSWRWKKIATADNRIWKWTIFLQISSSPRRKIIPNFSELGKHPYGTHHFLSEEDITTNLVQNVYFRSNSIL